MRREYLNHIQTQDTLTIIWKNDHPTQIPAEHKWYNNVVTLIRNGQFDQIHDACSVQPDKVIGKFTVQGNDVYDGAKRLPAALAKRILEFDENEIPIAPLEKFWANSRRNPNPDSIDDLYGFLEHNHVPITGDGCFIGYKAVTHDFKDIHSGKFSNKPGDTPSMARAGVNADRNVSCSTGFHIAAFEYADGFGGKGVPIVEVKVDPFDVVSVPTDYDMQKMRVCKYEVIRVNRKGERKENTYSGRRDKVAPKIRRIPSHLRVIIPDGRGNISISTELMERLGFKAGKKFFLSVSSHRSRNLTITAKKPKKAHWMAEMKVGKTSTRIFSPALKAAQIFDAPEYTAKFTKGNLEIRP